MRLEKKQKVNSVISDSAGCLSVFGILSIIEECITELLGSMELDDISVREKYNAVWVFVKTRFKRVKSIPWNASYTAECRITKVRNSAVMLDVYIRDESDETAVFGRTEICALDIATGRILKVSSLGMDKDDGEDALCDIKYTRFRCDTMETADEVRVKYSNVDFAMHTNNKEYVRFILDTYSVDDLISRPVQEMEIMYKEQSYEGDILTVKKGSDNGRDVFEIMCGDRTVIKSEIIR